MPRILKKKKKKRRRRRDITLLTKVHLVKAVVFPVAIYGCESWTIKKAECRGPVPVDPGKFEGETALAIRIR